MTASESRANQTTLSIIKKKLGISFSWKKTPHLLEKLQKAIKTPSPCDPTFDDDIQFEMTRAEDLTNDKPNDEEEVKPDDKAHDEGDENVKEKDKEGDGNKDNEKDKEKDDKNDKEKDRDKDEGDEKDKEKDKEKDEDKDKEKDEEKDDTNDKEKDKDKEEGDEKDKEKDKEKDDDKDKEKDKDKGEDNEEDKEKDKEKDDDKDEDKGEDNAKDKEKEKDEDDDEDKENDNGEHPDAFEVPSSIDSEDDAKIKEKPHRPGGVSLGSGRVLRPRCTWADDVVVYGLGCDKAEVNGWKKGAANIEAAAWPPGAHNGERELCSQADLGALSHKGEYALAARLEARVRAQVDLPMQFTSGLVLRFPRSRLPAKKDWDAFRLYLEWELGADGDALGNSVMLAVIPLSAPLHCRGQKAWVKVEIMGIGCMELGTLLRATYSPCGPGYMMALFWGRHHQKNTIFRPKMAKKCQFGAQITVSWVWVVSSFPPPTLF